VGDQARFNGRRGLCGLTGVLSGTCERPGLWVMFEPSDPTCPPEIALLSEANLVALPSPPPGAPHTPWEARRTALPPAVSSGPPLALTDEAAQEERLAIVDGPRGQQPDSASDAGSIDLTGDEDDSSEAGGDDRGDGPLGDFVASVGDLVSVRTLDEVGTRRGNETIRHGRVDGLRGSGGGATAIVRLLPVGPDPGGSADFVMASLEPAEEDQLILGAVCAGCDSAEPEEELLMCEGFGRQCLCCAHIGCLQPALKAVPKGPWMCQHCGGLSTIVASATPRKRARDSDADVTDGGRAATLPRVHETKANAKGKTKAVASAPAKAKGGSAKSKARQEPKKKTKPA